MEGNNRERKSVREQTQAPKGARLTFGIIMVIVYIAVGLLFILWRQFDVIIDHTVSVVVGSILIAYGLWRGYRLYLNNN